MINGQTKIAFYKSEKGSLLRKELERMVKDPKYNTRVIGWGVEPTGERFIEKHLAYMSSHPKMDHLQYVSNLKLMTKISN